MVERTWLSILSVSADPTTTVNNTRNGACSLVGVGGGWRSGDIAVEPSLPPAPLTKPLFFCNVLAAYRPPRDASGIYIDNQRVNGYV